MIFTLAIDPGAKLCGWASFADIELVKCGLVRGETLKELHTDAVCQIAFGPRTRVVVEKPRVYPVRAMKGDANDLVTIAFAAGVVVGAAAERIDEFQSAWPSEWKGSVPKQIHVKRTLAALTADERKTYERCVADAPVSLRHNCLDAIGLGLWAVGRKQRRRT